MAKVTLFAQVIQKNEANYNLTKKNLLSHTQWKASFAANFLPIGCGRRRISHEPSINKQRMSHCKQSNHMAHASKNTAE